MADQEHSYYVDEHNTIILNVATFKDLLAIGANLIKELEVKFGDITTPEFVKKLNEAQQQALTELERRSRDSHNDRPHYMG
jgi:ABC-type lipoprotein release transport system permease subunit